MKASHCHRQTARALRGIGLMFISRSLFSTTSATHTAIVTDSQEGCGWSDLQRSPKPHCYSSFTGYVQSCFECLQKSRLHCLSGQPVLLLCHPQRGFSSYSVEPPVFSLCPLLLVLVLGTTEIRVWPQSLDNHPWSICMHWLSNLFSSLIRHRCLSLSSWEMLQSPHHFHSPPPDLSSSSLSSLNRGDQN